MKKLFCLLACLCGFSLDALCENKYTDIVTYVLNRHNFIPINSYPSSSREMDDPTPNLGDVPNDCRTPNQSPRTPNPSPRSGDGK